MIGTRRISGNATNLHQNRWKRYAMGVQKTSSLRKPTAAAFGLSAQRMMGNYSSSFWPKKDQIHTMLSQQNRRNARNSGDIKIGKEIRGYEHTTRTRKAPEPYPSIQELYRRSRMVGYHGHRSTEYEQEF